MPGEELLEDLGHDPYARAGGFCDAHAQPLRFKPDGCRLQHRKFDAAGFLRLIRGRRVALLGDSVTRQWFEYLLGRLRRHAAPGGIVNIPYGQPSFSRPGCSVVPASRNQTTGPGRISLKCYTVRAGTTRFCHRFSVPGTRNATAGLCYIYANRDPLDEQNLPAFNALGRGDVVVASTGLHMNFAKLMQTTMQKFVKHLPLLKAVRKDRPIMVWRESSAQHFRFKPSGYWPPIHWVAQRQALRNVNPKTFRCSVRGRGLWSCLTLALLSQQCRLVIEPANNLSLLLCVIVCHLFPSGNSIGAAAALRVPEPHRAQSHARLAHPGAAHLADHCARAPCAPAEPARREVRRLHALLPQGGRHV